MNPVKQTLKDVGTKLVEMRQAVSMANRDPLEEAVYQKTRYAVSRKEILLAPGVSLDPNRPIRDTWKPTPYDDITSFTVDHRTGKPDVGFGVGTVPSTGGPYKVRWLVRPRLGEVEEVDALEYMQRRQSTKSPLEIDRPRFEPVPDNTPTCQPIFPPNMPTDYAKAVRIAAKALKKPEDDLKFGEVLEYFRNRPATTEVFKV